jgi:hypothetical protein
LRRRTILSCCCGTCFPEPVSTPLETNCRKPGNCSCARAGISQSPISKALTAKRIQKTRPVIANSTHPTLIVRDQRGSSKTTKPPWVSPLEYDNIRPGVGSMPTSEGASSAPPATTSMRAPLDQKLRGEVAKDNCLRRTEERRIHAARWAAHPFTRTTQALRSAREPRHAR